MLIIEIWGTSWRKFGYIQITCEFVSYFAPMASAGVGAQANRQYLGVTEPISLGGPTELDLVRTQELEKVRMQKG